MTALLLIVGLFAQLVNNTTVSVLRSTKGMDNTQLATVALDRIGTSITGMVASGTGTLVAYKNSTGSDGLAMITNGRVRSRTNGDQNINANSFTDIRMGARGFCVINTADPDLPASPSIPMLSLGDGTVVWSTTNNGTAVQGDPTTALSLAAQDIVTPPTDANSPGAMLDFSPLSRSIFRFELAFLLSDGTTVSGSDTSLTLLPSLVNKASANGKMIDPTCLPRNKYFVANEEFFTPPATFSAKAYPLAFSTSTSDIAPNDNSKGQNVYVRAVIVGIVSLDATTQKNLTGDQLTQLASLQTFPKLTDGKTPVQAWNISDQNGPVYKKIVPPNFPPPVLQNIRVTQRYYYVN